MAEIPGWLRGFRTRNPAVSPSIGQGSFPSDTQDYSDVLPQRESTRRPSFLNLTVGKPRKYEPLGLQYNEPQPDPQDTWHNPDIEQLVDALQVVMMTQNNFEPIPVRYNSCVMQILEGYGKHKAEMQRAKVTYMNVSEEHRLSELHWNQREADYKEEIKRLEVILASGERGLNLVTLARSSSNMERGSAGQRKRNVHEQHRKSAHASDAHDKDVQVSTRFITAQKRAADGQRIETNLSKRKIGHQANMCPSIENKSPSDISHQATQSLILAPDPQGHESTDAYSSDSSTSSEGSQSLDVPDNRVNENDMLSFQRTPSPRGSVKLMPAFLDVQNEHDPYLQIPVRSNGAPRLHRHKPHGSNSSNASNHTRGFSFALGGDEFEASKVEKAQTSTELHTNDSSFAREQTPQPSFAFASKQERTRLQHFENLNEAASTTGFRERETAIVTGDISKEERKSTLRRNSERPRLSRKESINIAAAAAARAIALKDNQSRKQ